jgi:hypothetical protein
VCANSPREISLGRASKTLLAGIGLTITVSSKLPWRHKRRFLPALPHDEPLALFVAEIECYNGVISRRFAMASAV